jgi:hypothetical protein
MAGWAPTDLAMSRLIHATTISFNPLPLRPLTPPLTRQSSIPITPLIHSMPPGSGQLTPDRPEFNQSTTIHTVCGRKEPRPPFSRFREMIGPDFDFWRWEGFQRCLSTSYHVSTSLPTFDSVLLFIISIIRLILLVVFSEFSLPFFPSLDRVTEAQADVLSSSPGLHLWSRSSRTGLIRDTLLERSFRVHK